MLLAKAIAALRRWLTAAGFPATARTAQQLSPSFRCIGFCACPLHRFRCIRSPRVNESLLSFACKPWPNRQLRKKSFPFFRLLGELAVGCFDTNEPQEVKFRAA